MIQGFGRPLHTSCLFSCRLPIQLPIQNAIKKVALNISKLNISINGGWEHSIEIFKKRTMDNTHVLAVWKAHSYQLPIQFTIADSVANSDCDSERMTDLGAHFFPVGDSLAGCRFSCRFGVIWNVCLNEIYLNLCIKAVNIALGT